MNEATLEVAHLKVFLHRDSSHRGANFTEDAQSKLTSGLAGTLGTKDDLHKKRERDP